MLRAFRYQIVYRLSMLKLYVRYTICVAYNGLRNGSTQSTKLECIQLFYAFDFDSGFSYVNIAVLCPCIFHFMISFDISCHFKKMLIVSCKMLIYIYWSSQALIVVFSLVILMVRAFPFLAAIKLLEQICFEGHPQLEKEAPIRRAGCRFGYWFSIYTADLFRLSFNSQMCRYCVYNIFDIFFEFFIMKPLRNPEYWLRAWISNLVSNIVRDDLLLCAKFFFTIITVYCRIAL